MSFFALRWPDYPGAWNRLSIIHKSKLFLGFTQIKPMSCPSENYSVKTHRGLLFRTVKWKPLLKRSTFNNYKLKWRWSFRLWLCYDFRDDVNREQWIVLSHDVVRERLDCNTIVNDVCWATTIWRSSLDLNVDNLTSIVENLTSSTLLTMRAMFQKILTSSSFYDGVQRTKTFFSVEPGSFEITHTVKSSGTKKSCKGNPEGTQGCHVVQCTPLSGAPFTALKLKTVLKCGIAETIHTRK